MGSVAATSGIADCPSHRRPVAAATDTGDGGKRSRALVQIAQVNRAPADPAAGCNALQRPSAAFLAQLIAAKRNLPQARERRRAEPHEAIAAYAATARAA